MCLLSNEDIGMDLLVIKCLISLDFFCLARVGFSLSKGFKLVELVFQLILRTKE